MKKSKLVFLGLILVAVPLIFQFALLTWMSGMLFSIAEESQAARESRNRIGRLSDCWLKQSDCFFLIFSVRNDVKEAEILKEISDIEQETNAILDGAITQENRDSINKIKTALRELTALAPYSISRGRQAPTFMERYSIAPKLAKAGQKFSDEITATVEKERQTRSQIYEISDALQDSVRNALIALVIVSIVFSTALAIFFAARIKNPINRISENLKLLSENKQLLPTLTWSDELGSLDRLIHTVAEERNQMLLRERSLFEKASDLICSLDENGTFLSVNPMAKRMLAMQPEKMIGMRLNELVAPEDSFAVDELVRRSISRNDFQTAELRLCKSDGTTTDTRWSCLWSDQEGSLFCVAHDITRENELAKVKQDFMNMISHDLRGPLTSIMGGLTMVANGIKGELSPTLLEEARSAVRSSEKLVSFINDLLDFQKLNVGEMPLELEQHQAQELIQEAFQLVSASAQEKSVELVYKNEKSNSTVYCDSQKIVQVLLNLFSNSIKFSPENSVVLVQTSEEPETITFYVSDSGPGIPEEMHQKIFEPFEQVQQMQHQGTGLGLAICKMIVETHGGKIGVRNRSDSAEHGVLEAGGSEFWFSLPSKRHPVKPNQDSIT